LAEEIEKNGGKVVLKREIKNNFEVDGFDKKIFTIASPIFLNVFPKLPSNYVSKLKRIKYIGSVAVVLILKKKVLDWVYWLNINEDDIPFLLCVEQTNLVSKKHYNDLYPFYIGTYVSSKSELFKKDADLILREWIKYLGKINKDFKKSWIVEFRVIKEEYTQPIFTVENFNDIPNFETPIKDVYLVNMVHTYPWDRGVSYAVDAARQFVLKCF
jgi:protoporphyrinogen oxidase